MRKKTQLKANPDNRQIITLSMKLNERLERLILEIGGAGDRGKSYVVRELLRRGLTLYKKDGQLKATRDEEEVIRQMIENSETALKQKTAPDETHQKNE